MIISNIEIDPPLEVENYEDFDLSASIETIRNLQYNIISELNKPVINFDYINECSLKINKLIEEIRESDN